MITEQDFMNQYDGFATEYSNYTVIGKDLTIQKVIDALNEINTDFVAGNGKVQEGKEGYKAIGFTISKQEPDVIFDLTEKLSCIGYAQGDLEFHAAKEGRVYNGFTAKWDSFEKHDEDENIYDAFFTVIDDESKISIPSGGGAVEEDIARDYLNVVNIHSPFRKENKSLDIVSINDGKDKLEYGETIGGLTFVSCKRNFLGDEDFNYTYTRESFYYEGTLVGELQHRSVSGEHSDKAIIYDKNSLGRTFESYLKKFTPYEVWDVSHSNDVVEFPGRREIVEDFKETYKVNGNSKELQDYIAKIPPYVNSDIEVTIEAGYINDVITDEIPKLFAGRRFTQEMMDFVDRRHIIDDIMRELNAGMLEQSLDDSFSINPAEFNLEEKVTNYIRNEAVYTQLEEAARFTIPPLVAEMDASYDADRATRVKFLREGYEPFSEPLADRLEAVNRGFYYMGNDAHEYVTGVRNLNSMRDLIQHTVNAVDTLEHRAFVTQGAYKDQSTNEIVALTLIGRADEYFEKHNDTIEDLTKDYQKFRDKFLPELQKVACQNHPENEPENISRMKDIKDYSQVFTSGKALFKTDFFKEPCNKFCEAVTGRMKEDAELKDFIKAGKLPTQGKTAQR